MSGCSLSCPLQLPRHIKVTVPTSVVLNDLLDKAQFLLDDIRHAETKAAHSSRCSSLFLRTSLHKSAGRSGTHAEAEKSLSAVVAPRDASESSCVQVASEHEASMKVVVEMFGRYNAGAPIEDVWSCGTVVFNVSREFIEVMAMLCLAHSRNLEIGAGTDGSIREDEGFVLGVVWSLEEASTEARQKKACCDEETLRATVRCDSPRTSSGRCAVATEPVGRERLGLAGYTRVCRTQVCGGLDGVLQVCGATFHPLGTKKRVTHTPCRESVHAQCERARAERARACMHN